MARYVITTPVTIPGAGYNTPPRKLNKGEVVELSAAEVTTITGAGGALRSGSTPHDTLGESFGVSN